jgi:flagella basal body P-ring formation protein FlgA
MKSVAIFVALTAAWTLSFTALAGALVRVSGARIVVSDIVPTCPEEARDVEVSRAPLPGRTAIVGKAEVVRALQAAGIDAATLRIPKSQRVLRPSRRPSEDELQAKVQRAIAEVIPEHARLVSLGPLPNVEVPLDEYEVRAQWSAGSSAGRRVVIPLALVSDGEEFFRWQASGEVVHESLLPVLVEGLPSGAIIREQDVELRPLAISRPKPDIATELSQVIGRRLTKAAASLEPMRLGDLEEIPIVKRGENMLLSSIHGAIRITTSAVAREDGALGARIRVVAGNTQRLLWAKIVAPGQAVVMP